MSWHERPLRVIIIRDGQGRMRVHDATPINIKRLLVDLLAQDERLKLEERQALLAAHASDNALHIMAAVMTVVNKPGCPVSILDSEPYR